MRSELPGCLLLLAFFVVSDLRADDRVTPERPNAPVFVIPIEGPIEPALLYVIRRGAAEAERDRAAAVIIRMDTPGGTVDAAEKIVRVIADLSAPTYTLVEKNAISAGAIIALATDHIYMEPGSKIGDALPILMTPFGSPQQMPEGIEEKSVSYVAGLIRSTAQRKGHDDRLAEAMVRRENEYRVDDWIVSPSNQLLTLTNLEAERLVGDPPRPLLSSGTVTNLEDLLNRMGLSGHPVRELNVTAAERVARVIAGLAPLLLMGGLLGLYIEIKTPGFGLPGILGILCLAMFFWGHHIAGLAGREEMLLFMLGLILLLIEVFVTPGFGWLGTLGLMLMTASMLGSMMESAPEGSWLPRPDQWQGPLLKLVGALVVTMIAGALIGRRLPRIRAMRPLVLDDAMSRTQGYTASSLHAELTGQTGRTLTPLRPSGAARFGMRRVDVVTRGDFIEADRPVRVTEVAGSRVIVEPVSKESSA